MKARGTGVLPQELRMAWERVGVGDGTIYAWLRAFILHGVESLRYEAPLGQPRKLTDPYAARSPAGGSGGAAGSELPGWTLERPHAPGSGPARVRRVLQRPLSVRPATQPGLLLPEGALHLGPPRRRAPPRLDRAGVAGNLAHGPPAWCLATLRQQASFAQGGLLSCT